MPFCGHKNAHKVNDEYKLSAIKVNDERQRRYRYMLTPILRRFEKQIIPVLE